MASKLSETVREKVKELVEPALEQEGIELVDVEYRREKAGWILRLFIDTKNGVTIDDCAQVSGRVGDILEVKDVFENAYILEVSSPGLDRPLKTIKDFKRALNKEVLVSTSEPVEGKNGFDGTVASVEEESFVVSCSDGSYRIPLNKVAKARFNIKF